MSKNIRVLVKHPGKPVAVEEIEDGLPALQALVGGYIEAAIRWVGFFGKDDLLAYVNEDGIAQELPPNVYRPTDGWLLLGTMVVVKIDGQTRDDMTMTEEEANGALVTVGGLRWA